MLLNIRTGSEEPLPVRCRGVARGFHTGFVFALLGCAIANEQGSAETKPAPKASPAFEVAAIKLTKADAGNQSVNSNSDRISIENYTLRRLIRLAWGLKSDTQITGGPDWMDKQAFDISAKIDDAEVAKMHEMKREERQRERNLLLQTLLADRFQLRAHQIEKILPVYALVLAKSEPRFKHSDPAAQGHSSSTNNGHMEAKSISMDSLAEDLTRMPESGDRVVVNRTGLAGDYDFKLDWTPDYGSGVPADATNPGLLTALQDQLGLKLESQKGPVEIVVVESAARPALD